MLRIGPGFWKGNLSRRFYGSIVKDAKSVRKQFLDYFQSHGHEFVRSSPVVPYNDPTTPFVNAGMNQFKGVLLGLNDPPALRVANSQKCIRVGGKHNDMDVVGTDTYHHTFFEMLGNWSFGDYFKKEACEYAWNLLTGPFGINKEHLYVTYFKGDEQLGIGPDLECKEIWKELGVSSDRILPFGTKDNFWEMGLTGPCGPCTEIHIDHAKLPSNQSDRVNKGHADLTELWNIVFIQHQRLPDGSIVPLPKHHVDTGMGFERLLAVVQNKRSNYDTDLFQDLFRSIENFAKVPKYEGRFGSADKHGMDTGYRLLADHARMVTVALSDGIIPDQNPKLRRVLRKAIDVSENIFHKNGLLNELSYRVVESLGETYPELEKNIEKVRNIIHYEEDILKSLRDKTECEWKKIVKTRPQLAAISEVTPGLIPAYKELQNQLKADSNLNTISGRLSYRLYDTYGLNVDTISELAKLESLNFDIEEFKKELDKMQEQSRLKHAKTTKTLISESVLNVLTKMNVPKTNDSYKYVYSYDDVYKFPTVTCKLLDIIVDDNLLSQSGLQIFDESQLIVEATVAQSGNVVQSESIINPTTEVAILLDETPCYATEGGQLPDKGYIFINDLLFAIKEVRKIRDYVFHIGHFVIKDETNSEFEVQVGDECRVVIDESQRLGLMQHHTATHLLNAALRKILPVSGQRGSSVSKDSLSYECSIFGNKLNQKDAQMIEKLVNDTIKAKVPVKTKSINMLQLLAADDIVTIPGEIYPDDKIRVVEIDGDELKSKEACCGTHVLNTSHLDHFCILNIKSEGRVSCSIKAAVGPLAEQAKKAGENFVNKLAKMENEFLNSTNSVHKKIFNKLLHEIKVQLKDKNNKNPVSYVDVQSCMKKIEDIQKAVEVKEREDIRNSIEAEMKKILQSSALPFVVHYVRPNEGTLDSFPLPKITKLYSNIPVFIIAYSQGTVEARCCVPKQMISDVFNAQSWMRTVLPILNSQTTSTSNQEVCNMKTKPISYFEMKVLVDKCIAEASNFASQHLKKMDK